MRTYGREFPERPLMAEISDLLDIEHYTTSRGETVRRDFLEAVALALHVPRVTVEGVPTKDDLLKLVIESATGAPANPELFSVGGTVTNDALRVILKGLRQRRLGQRR